MKEVNKNPNSSADIEKTKKEIDKKIEIKKAELERMNNLPKK